MVPRAARGDKETPLIHTPQVSLGSTCTLRHSAPRCSAGGSTNNPPSRAGARWVHIASGMASRARFPPVVVHSHARSGSTLLIELLGRDPQIWITYEPLQDVRQLPPTAAPMAMGGCRSAETGASGDPLVAQCPWRDATLLVALLACDTLPLLTTWYTDFELGGRRGGFVPHYDPPIPGSEWANTSQFPEMAISRAAQYREQARACRERPGHAVKTVRMNGQLDALYKVSHAFGKKAPLVLHLVRKPFSVYASRKNLSKPFGLPTAAEIAPARRQRLREWAQSMCTATRHDVATGRAQAAGAYDLVTFAELVRRPRQLVERLYSRHFHRAVPRAVYAFISTHIRSNESAVESDAWEFKYGTSARSVERVEQRWREQLEPWEVREIEAVCGRGALTSSDRGGGGGGSEESSSPAEASRYGKVGVGGKPKAARPGKAQRRSGR